MLKDIRRNASSIALAAGLATWAAVVYGFYMGQFSQYFDAARRLLWR